MLEYQKRLMYLGRLVDIFDAGLQNILYSGVFEGVDQSGFACVRNTQDQHLEIVSNGRMRPKPS